MLNPAAAFILPELSIVPTLVAEATLEKEVGAYQLKATLVSPLADTLEALPTVKPSESKLFKN